MLDYFYGLSLGFFFNKPYITVLVFLEKQDNDYVLHLVWVSHYCLMPKLWQEQVTFDEMMMFALY
jgi:hypothetical protein